MKIRTFYAPNNPNGKYRAGIIINPLPNANYTLSNRIDGALKEIGIQSSQHFISDPTSILPWCKAVGIQPIDTDSLLGIWIYDKDPETCIQVVREVVSHHIAEAIA